jgi:signal transduction histidine kinase
MGRDEAPSRRRRIGGTSSNNRRGAAPRFGLLLILALASRAAIAEGVPIDVLFISSLDAGSPDTTIILDAFKSGIAEKGRRAEVFLEALDVLRFPWTPHRERAFAAYLADRYGGYRFDVIIAQASEAFAAAVPYRNAHAPGVPVYGFHRIDMSLIARYSSEAEVYSRVLSGPFPPTLRLAAGLFPKARKLYLTGTMNPGYMESFEKELRAIQGELPGLEIVFAVNAEYAEVETLLSKADADSMVLLLPGGWRLPNGGYVGGTDMVDRLSSAAPIPFFGVQESSFGTGLVGGYLIDREKLGREAAEIAQEILFGGKPERRLVSEALVPTLDARALKRFSVPASLIPGNARILFAPPAFWLRHEELLKAAGAALLVALVALLVLVLVRRREAALFKEANIRLERSVAESTRDLRTANTELEASNANLEESLKRIEEMQDKLVEETRDTVLGRVALGLAHEINTPLAAIKAAADSARSLLGTESGGLPAALSKLDERRLALFFKLMGKRPQSHPGIEDELYPTQHAGFEARLYRLGVDHDRDLVEVLLEAGLDSLPDADLALLCIPANRDLLECLYLDRALDRSIGITLVAAERIAQVLEAVRNYSRDPPKDVSKASSSIGESLDRALFLFREAMRKGASIDLRLESGLPPVPLARTHLVRIWTSLIQNAIRAMDGEGDIVVTARRSGGSAIVEVTDSGPGVPLAIRDKLFTPFATADDPEHGMGLGLSICKRIVEGAHGEISYEERDGRTVFSVRLPFVERPHDK